MLQRVFASQREREYISQEMKMLWIEKVQCVLFAGLFVGALIRYAASKTTTTHLTVYPNVTSSPTYNQSLPPDILWLNVIEYLYIFLPQLYDILW